MCLGFGAVTGGVGMFILLLLIHRFLLSGHREGGDVVQFVEMFIASRSVARVADDGQEGTRDPGGED